MYVRSPISEADFRRIRRMSGNDELVVHWSAVDDGKSPQGDLKGHAMIEYGKPGEEYPLIGEEYSWDVGTVEATGRLQLSDCHYWLCIPMHDTEA